MGKRIDGNGLVILGGDAAKAGKSVAAVDVHGTRTANTLTARATEGDGTVLLVLDLDESIENHGATVLHVNLEGLELGGLRVLRVPAT